MSNLAVDSFFPQWNIWTQFLGDTTAGLKLDSLTESHPIEVNCFVTVQEMITFHIGYLLCIQLYPLYFFLTSLMKD
jgi:aminopeptidase N